MLTKKSVLETVGGLGHFGQYLAEDFFLAKDIAEWVAAHVDLSFTGPSKLHCIGHCSCSLLYII